MNENKVLKVMVNEDTDFIEITESISILENFLYDVAEENKVFYFKTQEQADILNDLCESEWDSLDDDYYTRYTRPEKFIAHEVYGVYNGCFGTLQEIIEKMKKTIDFYNDML